VGERELPGRGTPLPPPTSPALETEWCGSRSGGVSDSGASGARSPASEWTAATSRASSGDSGGSRPWSRRASIVFPQPGGPASSRWCPPAAASSTARRAIAWPRTSTRSSSPGGGRGRRGVRGQRPELATQHGDDLPEVGDRHHLHAGRERGLGRRRRARRAAVGPRHRGRRRRREHPRHGPHAAVEAELPDRPQPVERVERHLAGRGEHGDRDPEVEPGAPLGRSAGARLTTIRSCGQVSRWRAIAVRTRSAASRIAASGSPVSRSPGRPGPTAHSIRTGRASSPTSATPWTVARTPCGAPLTAPPRRGGGPAADRGRPPRRRGGPGRRAARLPQEGGGQRPDLRPLAGRHGRQRAAEPLGVPAGLDLADDHAPAGVVERDEVELAAQLAPGQPPVAGDDLEPVVDGRWRAASSSPRVPSDAAAGGQVDEVEGAAVRGGVHAEDATAGGARPSDGCRGGCGQPPDDGLRRPRAPTGSRRA
jgi:hypothetical protein